MEILHKVTSSYKILLDKVLENSLDESAIQWALDMMMVGYESDDLYILAGLSKPYNQFELRELIDKVLKEFQIDYSNKEMVVNNYVYNIISNKINDSNTYLITLRELKNLYIKLNMPCELANFYNLYFAKEDLMALEHQWYWEEANRSNIDNIIKEQFEIWLNQSPKP